MFCCCNYLPPFYPRKLTISFLTGKPVSHCQKIYQEKSRHWVLANRHVPWCQEDGAFQMKQCYRDNCFCINKRGVYRSGTRVEVSSGRITCEPSGNKIRRLNYSGTRFCGYRRGQPKMDLLTGYKDRRLICQELQNWTQ